MKKTIYILHEKSVHQMDTIFTKYEYITIICWLRIYEILILGSRGDQGNKGDMGLMGIPGRVGERGPLVRNNALYLCIYW